MPAHRLTFTCGNCGYVCHTISEFISHVTKDNWYCWHKEHGGYLDISPQPHNCERPYCEGYKMFLKAISEIDIEEVTLLE